MGDAAQRQRLRAGKRRAHEAEGDLPDGQMLRIGILSAEPEFIMAISDFPVWR
jgi:predicted component of type VI protein secretion system